MHNCLFSDVLDANIPASNAQFDPVPKANTFTLTSAPFPHNARILWDLRNRKWWHVACPPVETRFPLGI